MTLKEQPFAGGKPRKRGCLARGGIAVTLVRDGKLISWSFGMPTSESYMPYVDQKIFYPPDAASIYSGYVAPHARGGGIHRQQQNRRIAALLDRCSAVFSFAEGGNKAAIKAAMGSALHHVATLETRWQFYRARKRIIVIDPALDMKFEAPLYTPAGEEIPSHSSERGHPNASNRGEMRSPDSLEATA
ncbi:hypothetical protein [Sphingosinicella microcystinivorans]|uniref:hypothetical protein n=1 Tax=Sphingosinicella microcystinivorans TaxID=335406 RepID=UPI0022F39563|nr:hypothetical protein [Sphingosinicella microcystinivorans]WBX85605.1 hypothetical protein PE061_06740 [Sphingosinicella microcystinivorans]